MQLITDNYDPADQLSTEVSELIGRSVRGFKKPDRMAITMCAVLNAIEGSPDLPRDLKDALGDAFKEPEDSKGEPTDIAKRTAALLGRVRQTEQPPARNDQDLEAFTEFAMDISHSVIFAILRSLKQLGWDDSEQINEVVSYALLHTLFALDATPDGEIKEFGGACKGMLEALTAMKEHIALAA